MRSLLGRPVPDSELTHTWIELRFPLGTYNAQSMSDFRAAEWPPHPVRVIAAFVAAAAVLPEDVAAQARAGLDVLAACGEAPMIVAPRADGEPDGLTSVARFRGASRWAPRNHELGELKAGIHPRELGRGRAEINKGGVAVGDQPVSFVWPVVPDERTREALRRAAENVAFLGSSRSPVVVTVSYGSDAREGRPAWVASGVDAERTVDVRIPTATLLTTLDATHEQRKGSPTRDGRPARATFVTPPSLGRWQRYVHTSWSGSEPAAFDPRHWGDLLVLAVDDATQVWPKAPAAYVLARATRAALLARYKPAGQDGQAPNVLCGRGAEPHAAFVPLPFVGHPHADGRILGLAIVLPHARRAADVLQQRRNVLAGIRSLLSVQPGGHRVTIGVPGIGDVLLAEPPVRPLLTLQPSRWSGVSREWATVTPVVHSRYQRNSRASALLDQVGADCRAVGLPQPERVELLRSSPFHAAPVGIGRCRGPADWAGPLRGPVAHLRVSFPEPVVGPVLLGKARHFGLGLCLPTRP